MERVCFVFELNPGCEESYDDAHRDVWPEELTLLDDAGVYDYSIFRNGTMLYAFLKVRDDWETASRIVGASEVQARWEELMAPFVAWQKDENGQLCLAREVFRHEGDGPSSRDLVG